MYNLIGVLKVELNCHTFTSRYTLLDFRQFSSITELEAYDWRTPDSPCVLTETLLTRGVTLNATW